MSSSIILTTGDLKQDYEVIGPVYFQLSNRGAGLFKSSTFKTLQTSYEAKIAQLRKAGTLSDKQNGSAGDFVFGFFGEMAVTPNQYEIAFFIACEELKKRAALMNADAIVCMRQDIDLDTQGIQFFYLQMYGTAVRFTTA